MAAKAAVIADSTGSVVPPGPAVVVVSKEPAPGTTSTNNAHVRLSANSDQAADGRETGIPASNLARDRSKNIPISSANTSQKKEP